MRQITTSSLGYDVPVTDVPELKQGPNGEPDFSEFITAFGSADAFADAAITYVRLHRTNTEVRDELCDRIAKVTGVDRKTVQVKKPTDSDPNRMVEEFDESEKEYADRAHAQVNKKAAELAPQVLDGFSVKFEAKGEARTGAGRKMAKIYTDAAGKLIQLGPDKFNPAIAQVEQANPGTTVEREEDGTPKMESLANALRVNQQRVINEANAALGIAA